MNYGIAEKVNIDPEVLDKIVDGVLRFTEMLVGHSMYTYQWVFAKRLVESLLSTDGSIITALWSRQCGKTQAVSDIAISIAVIVPAIAKSMPDVEWLRPFAEGIRIGIFAPVLDQAQISYDRMRTTVESDRGKEILADPELDVRVVTSRGDSLTLSNGSMIRARSASPDSKIEGGTFHVIIIDEAQEVDRFKVEKSIEPMRASTNGVLVKIGTAFLSRGGFHSDIEYNIELRRRTKVRNHFEFPYDMVIAERAEAYKRDKNPFHLAYANYVDGQKKRYGENSLSFRMNFKLEWQESNLDAISPRALLDCQDMSTPLNVERQWKPDELRWTRVAGIDLGRTRDSTVVTIMEVDLENPTRVKDSVSGDIIELVNKRIIAILELQGHFEDQPGGDEGQYTKMQRFLREWGVVHVVMDATGNQDTQYERMMVLCPELTFEPFHYAPSNKSKLFTFYLDEFIAGRIKLYSGSNDQKKSQDLPEWNQFMEQHRTLEKEKKGQLLVVQAPQPTSTARRIEGTLEYHDDYPNSGALATWATKSDMLGGVKMEPWKLGATITPRGRVSSNRHALSGASSRYAGSGRRR